MQLRSCVRLALAGAMLLGSAAAQQPTLSWHAARPNASAYAAAPTAPDAPSYTRALTTREKFELYVQSTYSPLTLVQAGLEAQPTPAYHAFSRNYRYSLASEQSEGLLKNFVLPYLLKQDPRYISDRNGNFAERASHAVSRVLVTRTDAGESTFNSSRVLGTFMAKAAAGAYDPQTDPFYRNSRSAGRALSRTGVSLATDAGMNLLREFWPDVKKRLAFWRK